MQNHFTTNVPKALAEAFVIVFQDASAPVFCFQAFSGSLLAPGRLIVYNRMSRSDLRPDGYPCKMMDGVPDGISI
jgi:hypothetical protein